MVRRAMAGGVGVVVLLLLVLAVRGCLSSRKDTALRDYVRNGSALINESNQESGAFFRVLSSGSSGGNVDTQNALNTVNSQTSQLLDRVQALSHPGEVDAAQTALVETFRYRRDAVTVIATQLRQAGSNADNQRQAASRIAATMRLFLASDVIYETRALPALNAALQSRSLAGDTFPRSQFLPDTGWLDANTVGSRIVALGGAGGAANKPASPGTHGTGISSATLGGQALNAGGSAANVSLAGGLTLSVQITNQGQNTEQNVKVDATIGASGATIKGSGTLSTIAAGETKGVDIKLSGSPPTGQNVPIQVTVAAVPGEKKTDNNKASYSAIFTR